MRYEVIRAVAEQITLKIQYENPVDPSQPLLQDGILVPGQTQLDLESPPLPAIQDGHVYRVSIFGYATGSKTPLFEHVQSIKFLWPPGI